MNKKLKRGGYTAILAVIAVAALLVFNENRLDWRNYEGSPGRT